jgi:uncharacterized protein with HEPN domain
VRDDQVHLGYVTESLEAIDQYLAGPDGAPSEQAFFGTRVIREAVFYRLETLCEAAGRLSPALKARHPEIPWAQVAGFRNLLAHAYTTVEPERVWLLIQQRLPALRELVDKEMER